MSSSSSSCDTAPSVFLAPLITHRDLDGVAEHEHASPILSLAESLRRQGHHYHSLCVPLTTPQWRQRWSHMCLQPIARDRDVDAEKAAEHWRAQPGFLRGELTMTTLDESERVTVMVADWLELDSDDDWIRHDAAIALHQELAYASYLSVPSAILPPPRSRTHIASYARAVAACLAAIPHMLLSIQLPPYDPALFHSPSPPAHSRSSSVVVDAPKVLEPSALTRHAGDLDATWELWDIVRSICDYNVRLSLALDLSLPLPSVLGSLSKWTAEPVRYIFLPSSTFLSNTRGYPVLPKVTQSFLRTSMTHRPTVILSGVSLGHHAKGGEAAYSEYVRHLERTSPTVVNAGKQGSVEQFAMGYQDYLQAPLQPLMDNLQSVTYQTFEQDPVKYGHYEEAMYRALCDWPVADDDGLVICVAGAGRGPLVARALNALQRANKQATVYAIEKNQNALVTLQNRLFTSWSQHNVHLFFGDMRTITLPRKVDILVSELLGSFGDNELSPECLDGAMRFLKDGGISIPAAYTAHVAPLSSSKLYNEARAGKDPKNMETPYVVMFQAVNILSDDGTAGTSSSSCGPQIQECWEFEHPRKGAILDDRGLPLTNTHNTRSAKLRFHIPHAGVLHGLAGYFEAVLYGNVGLSIHPHRKDQISKDMLSWFPLFFPFKDPLYLPSNSQLEVSIWRQTDQRQVWYEWHAESFLPIPNSVLTSTTPPRSSLDDVGDRPTSSVSTLSAMSGPMSAFGFGSPVLGMSSPLVDAVDVMPMPTTPNPHHMHKVAVPADGAGGYSLVKIGQSSLHNPGGRSSWIGL